MQWCHQSLLLLILKKGTSNLLFSSSHVPEEERKMGFFSPNFDGFCASHAKEESCNINVQAQSSIASNQDSFPADMSKTDTNVQLNGCRASSRPGGIGSSLLQTSSDDFSHQILIDDVLCVTCKQLLFRPVVLNCGHGNG